MSLQERQISQYPRREIINLSFLRRTPAYLRDIQTESGSVANPNQPPSPHNPFNLGQLAFFGGVLASLNLDSKVDRRSLIKWMGVTGGIAAGVVNKLYLPNKAKAEQFQIVEIDYEKALGRDISYPWLGLRNGLKAAGLEEGGPWDKYDRLDQKINGRRARSVYWPEMGGPGSTREWLTWVLYDAIQNKANEYMAVNPRLDQATAEGMAINWTGYCFDGIAASYFAPVLRGPFPRTILGIDYYEEDVMTIATMENSGLAREPLDLSNVEEVARRVNNGEAVAMEYSEIDWQEWWGLAIYMEENGMVTIVNASELGDQPGLQTLRKHISEIRQAMVIDKNKTQPGYEGNRAVVNPLVGGLILETHQLLAA